METMTWDDQGDGIYVPLHQEPADCPAGRQPHPEPHGASCGCSGTGFTFEGGYRHRCLGGRLPTPDLPPLDDPWASAATYPHADDYPG
ncbi:hypothetical protein ACWC5I_48830 [Kitasatospora sp. NPDC001574]